MSSPVILLVEADPNQAHLMARAIERLALPRPVHITSGEAAVLWVGANPCDVCVLDYRLPGIDGVETFLRIRQRKPALPVIMVSDARSEQVAIAAFHTGVVDYVPKQAGFEAAVAHLVQQVMQGLPASEIIFPQLTSADIPDHLLRPTYQNRLRVIGWQLDAYEYHSINLVEVGGGFLVRALPPGSRTPEALEFSNRDFPQLVAKAIAHRGVGERPRAKTPLLPTGYEDFLRALGHHFDAQLAEAIIVTELEDFIAVGALVKVDATGQTVIKPSQMLLRADDIAYLLDEAFRRRAPMAPQKSSTVARLLGRQ